MSDDEEEDVDWGGDGVLGSILPVRSEVLAGDLRALYLLWLLGVQTGDVDPDAVEPFVPNGLGALTGSQAALAEFLRIDDDLLDEAADGSAAARSVVAPDVEAWVAGLTADERDSLLVGLLRGNDPHLRTKTVRQMVPDPDGGRARRTAGQLLDAAALLRDGREWLERQRLDKAAAEHTRQAAEARRTHLARLTAEGEAAWQRVATRIAEKNVKGYDVAVGLLADLQEVTDESEFARRVQALKDEHRRRPALMDRLRGAGL